MAAMTEKAGTQSDIVIAGCGPAGALLAVRLARLGYRVVCIAATGRPHRVEGLGQRTVDVMRANGLAHSLDAIGPLVPRHAVWAGEAADHNREHLVSRDRLDAGLIADASQAGVTIVHGRCETVTIAEDCVALFGTAGDGTAIGIEAAFFVEARGRAAPRIRKGGFRGPETTALVRKLTSAGSPGTMIESLPDGWVWHVSDGEQALLQVFLDSSGGLPKRDGLVAHYETLASRAEAVAERIGKPASEGPVMSRNAATLLSGDLIAPRSLRVGDAAAAVDPLSGHGVFAALGSALAASAVINTLLQRPWDNAAAMRFYTERTEQGALRNARIGRDFYRLEQQWQNHAFWRARRDWPDAVDAHGRPDPGTVRIGRMPVVRDNFIEEAEVILTPDHPRGVWRVDDVALVPLLRAAHDAGPGATADFVDSLADRLDVRPAQIASALNWLKSAGAL